MIEVGIWIWAAGVVLTAALIALATIDYRTGLLPDSLTLPLIAVGLGQAWGQGALRDAAIGAAAGYLAFVALEKAYLRLRGAHGLGRGDAKLLAAGGAWCGWYGLPYIVLVASVSGLALVALSAVRTGRRPDSQTALAFGPHLALGVWSVWVAKSAVGGGLLP
ncbi:MAG: A24 family peptidase [Pseudomonadota bacterium]